MFDCACVCVSFLGEEDARGVLGRVMATESKTFPVVASVRVLLTYMDMPREK